MARLLRWLFAAGAVLVTGSCVLPTYYQEPGGDPCSAAALDDDNPCTVDACDAGKAVHTPEPDGEPCSAEGAPGACKAGACHVVPCDPAGKVDECDDGEPCTVDACDATTSYCVWANLDGTLTPGVTPVVGDCKQSFCVGGKAVELPYPDDEPQDVACFDEACQDGEPVSAPSAAGTPCGQLTCDGEGACAGCLTSDQCPGDVCNTPVCDGESGKCTTMPAGAGFPIPDPMQTPNDCQVLKCDESGGIVSVADDFDVPLPDADPCTLDICVGGTPQHPPAPVGTGCPLGVCSASGGCVQCTIPEHCPGAGACAHATCDNTGLCGVGYDPQGSPCGAGTCDGAGSCTGCGSDSQCGMSTECTTYACQSGQCTSTHVSSGHVLSMQTAGDCSTKVCDGNGGITGMTDDMDAPSDWNDCTADSCMNGTPKHTALPSGTPCAGGAKVCNGSGVCVSCVVDGDCPAPANPCKDAKCNAGTCGEVSRPEFTPCGTNMQCSAGGVCKLANGQTCPGNESLCASGKCKNGVCCETGCGSSGCIACLEIYTGQPDGDCAGVLSGTDPFNFCDGTQVCKWMGPQWYCAEP